MVEPLGREPSLSSNTEASFALLRSLARDYPIDLSRLELLQDLFFPQHANGSFAMWVAMSLDASNTDASSEPASVTTHFPIKGYAEDDRTVHERVVKCLGQLEIPAADYSRTISSYANRRLDAAIGLHSYVSFRRERSGPRLTVYLACEAYCPNDRAQEGISAMDGDAVHAANSRRGSTHDVRNLLQPSHEVKQ